MYAIKFKCSLLIFYNERYDRDTEESVARIDKDLVQDPPEIVSREQGSL